MSLGDTRRPRPATLLTLDGERARGEQVALALLGLLVVAGPQLYGGVFPWTVVVIAVAALAALLATWWSAAQARPRGTPWVALAISGAAAWTLLQSLPLPCGLVAWLAPDAAAGLRASLALTTTSSPSFCTLSHDPGATRLELLKGVGIIASFLSAWWLSAQGHRGRVILLVACSSAVMAAVALLHLGLGLEEVFGVYRPLHAGGGLVLAPLMNPNNLGAFAALGVPLWLAILQREREPRTRALSAFAIVISAAVALLSLSRGAIAMLVGCGTWMLLLSPSAIRASKRDRGARRQRPRWALGAALSLGLALGAYLAADRVLAEFRGDASKLGLIWRTLLFAAHHPWIGVGRGAFGSTFLSNGAPGYYAYTENFFTQWAADWGFPVALGLLGALSHAVFLAARGNTSWRRLGAVVGLVGLAAQNLVDLGLELAGVAVVAAALLAAVVAPAGRSEESRSAQRLPFQRMALGATMACSLVLVWLGPSAEADSRNGLDAKLRSQLASKDRAGFRKTLGRALRLHPAEALFPVLAAAQSLVYRDRAAPRFINRGLSLAPGWATPHVQAFQWLWLIGHRDQALLEMRVAAEIDASALGAYICRVAELGSAVALQGAPRRNAEQRAAFLETASSCLGVGNPVSAQLDDVLLQEFRKSPAAIERNALRLARAGRVDAAIAMLDALRRENPRRVQSRTLRVQLLFDAQRYAEAALSALELARSVPQRDAAPLWRVRAQALATLQDDAGWRVAISTLRRIASDDADQLAETYEFEGALHLQRGQVGEALRAYRAAYRINGKAEYLRSYAEISTQFGDRASALWAYMELCQSQPKNPNDCARRDALVSQGRAMNLDGKVRN
jgi:tetratricopeptide (TPR) repeat protein